MREAWLRHLRYQTARIVLQHTSVPPVHCYVAFTIYGGLKNFRRDRLRNAQVLTPTSSVSVLIGMGLYCAFLRVCHPCVNSHICILSKNTQEFGDGTHHIGGGSGKVHIQHTNNNSGDGNNSRDGGRSNSYRANSLDSNLQEEVVHASREGMSLET